MRVPLKCNLVCRADCGIGAGDIIEHYDSIRCTLLRMHVIKRTDFIPSGECCSLGYVSEATAHSTCTC